MKVRKAGAKIKSFLFALLMLSVVTALFLLFTNKYFFKVKNIVISENEKYSYDKILAASGIVLGEELYGINIEQAKNNIKEILPYTETVNIKRILPSTVNIEIKTAKGILGIKLGGDYYIISDNFMIVEKIKLIGTGIIRSEFRPPPGVITFETDTVKKCYLGEKIEFFDGDIYDFLYEIISLHKENEEVFLRITDINIMNKFKVVMNYENKFMVNFGIFENISSKILNSFEIIDRLPDYAKGIIDMTDDKSASFTYDENVSILYMTK